MLAKHARQGKTASMITIRINILPFLEIITDIKDASKAILQEASLT